MAGGEILHQSLAFLAADLGRKRKKRLGRRAGDAGGYFGILDVEPILVEKMGARARFHDVERDRHLVGRQLEVDVAVNAVEHHLAFIGLRFLDVAQVHLLADRSEEHTSELQSLMRTSYAV